MGVKVVRKDAPKTGSRAAMRDGVSGGQVGYELLPIESISLGLYSGLEAGRLRRTSEFQIFITVNVQIVIVIDQKQDLLFILWIQSGSLRLVLTEQPNV